MVGGWRSRSGRHVPGKGRKGGGTARRGENEGKEEEEDNDDEEDEVKASKWR